MQSFDCKITTQHGRHGRRVWEITIPFRGTLSPVPRRQIDATNVGRKGRHAFINVVLLLVLLLVGWLRAPVFRKAFPSDGDLPVVLVWIAPRSSSRCFVATSSTFHSRLTNWNRDCLGWLKIGKRNAISIPRVPCNNLFVSLRWYPVYESMDVMLHMEANFIV